MDKPAHPHDTLAAFLSRGLVVVVLNSVIALGLALRNEHLDVQMVYSHAIGLTIWLTIEAGRFVFRRDPHSNWPAGWRRYVLLVAGIVVGYVVGMSAGASYSGSSNWAALQSSPRQTLGYLFLSVTVSGAITYFFYIRGRGESMERLAATAQRDASQAQLQLLSSQLEPHMLFNTLANLRVLIAVDPPRAQEMLDHLVAFMRSTLTASRGMLHPLSSEFARLNDYLALMKIRMGDRLVAELRMPDDLGELAVPTLLLQPLVENAIKHGLEPKVEGGRLIVSASRDGADLKLTVRDTGVGLSTVANDGTHFGVSQVRERLATLYGEVASLTLAPADDAEGGVAATVRIPLNRTT
ncbi:sensor histidine kinase [Piscinibacter sp. HJYY11]|uniref:sensor histidine kinase n=1 Tax=Piscinibacter sp. HJYY11 TaxID=2801333 RepID=UPI00191CBEC4|nr:histidine kinase [Piscinibacter sp. HJYY11]MBL0727399.1 histidine kinase [Piscinibacter sp. HJYY11]